MRVVLVLLLAALASPAAAQGPPPGDNGMDMPWGSIRMPPHLHTTGEPVDITVRVEYKPAGPWEGTQALLFAFDVQSPSVALEFLEITDASGRALPLHEDKRAEGESKVLVATEHVAAAGTVLMHARASAANNGRFHVGAFVIAFDDAWLVVMTPEAMPAQLYAYTLLGTTDVTRGFGAPPFEGDGNAVPLPPVVERLLKVLALGLLGTVAFAGGVALNRLRSGRTPGP